MTKQSKWNISKYYGVIRFILILLIIGRVVDIISMIVEFNKPVDENIVEVLNQRSYKISIIVGSILDIILLSIFYKIVSV
jgi:hypothetical protein